MFRQKIFMLSKRYESAEVDRKTWLYVPSGTHDPPAVTLKTLFQYKKEKTI